MSSGKMTTGHVQRRAVFIDRDGTINEEVGYLDDPARLRLFPFAAEAIRLINRSGLLVIVVTNQSGVARGLFNEEILARIHERMRADLLAGGALIDAIYYCPHHPEIGSPTYRRHCQCRKPQAGMLQRAANDFEIDLGRSYLIGDRLLDVATANAAGVIPILVETGDGRREWETAIRAGAAPPPRILPNLLAAAQLIARCAPTEQTEGSSIG
jgi:D-glycero-D-manno-heptose 1,7-bisphosphate phosphatase